jgi:hypothetical protein
LFRSERGSSSFDVRWRSTSFFVCDLPSVAKGFQVSGIAIAQTGQPYT